MRISALRRAFFCLALFFLLAGCQKTNSPSPVPPESASAQPGGQASTAEPTFTANPPTPAPTPTPAAERIPGWSAPGSTQDLTLDNLVDLKELSSTGVGNAFELVWAADSSAVFAVFEKHIIRYQMPDWKIAWQVDSSGTIGQFAITPDGSRYGWISFGEDSADTRIQVGDAQSGKLDEKLGHYQLMTRPGGRGNNFAFSQDGKQVYYVSYNDLSLEYSLVRFDLETHHAEKLKEDIICTSWRFSPDGRTLATYAGDHDEKIYLYDLATLQERLVYDGEQSRGYRFSFTPDSALMLASTFQKEVLVDVRSGETLPEVESIPGYLGDLSAAAVLSPDRLAVVQTPSGENPDPTPILLFTPKGAQKTKLEGESGLVNRLSRSPDGRWLVSGEAEGWLRLWDLTSGREVSQTRTGFGGILFSCLADHGGLMVLPDAGWSGGARLFDLRTGELTSLQVTEPGQEILRFRTVACQADGPLAAFNYQEKIAVWDLTAKKLVSTLQVKSSNGAFEIDGLPVISAEGRLLALPARAGSSEKVFVQLWDLHTGQLLYTLEGANGRIFNMAFSPDGSRLLAGDIGGLVLWSTTDGSLLSQAGDQQFEPLALDYHVIPLALGQDGTTGRLVHRGLAQPQGTWSQNLQDVIGYETNIDNQRFAYSPDGKWIAAYGKVLRLIDASNGQVVRYWSGSAGQISEVSWSPDGKIIYLVTINGVIQAAGVK